MADDCSDERPAAGARQTDDDVATTLPPGGRRKEDTGGLGDVDRAEPYDDGGALRLADLDQPDTV
jgi:hypothetical protein